MKNLIIMSALLASCALVSSNRAQESRGSTLQGFACKDSKMDLGPDWDSIYFCAWDGGSGFVAVQRFEQPYEPIKGCSDIDAGEEQPCIWPLGDYPGTENAYASNKG